MLKNPLDLPHPRSAWLLFGDEASFPVDGVEADDDQSSWNWTACPHVEVGDTLFFYFLAPRKAIYFVGRAVTRPYLDPDRYVNSDSRHVDPHQWWVDYDAVVEIAPISFKEINDACDEPLVMRGRSGKYIRTKAANNLLGRAKIRYSSESWREEMALEEVEGRFELPVPGSMDLQALRDLPASRLRLETDVEEFVVEPLYRLLGLRGAYRLQRRLRLKRKVADYAIFKNGKPHCIIEAKLRTHLDRDRNWGDSPDVQQAQEYAKHLEVNFLVVDCDEVFCFDAGAVVPRLQYERRNLTNADMAVIRSHITGIK